MNPCTLSDALGGTDERRQSQATHCEDRPVSRVREEEGVVGICDRGETTGMRQGYLIEVVKDQCVKNRFVAGGESGSKHTHEVSSHGLHVRCHASLSRTNELL